MIDAGFSARQIRQRLATLGRTPETLTGIVITHDHSDHTQGLSVLCAKLDIPIYCNRFTQEVVASQSRVPLNWKLFGTGQAFEVGDVVVESFSVPHDAQDPLGFLLRTPGGKVGVLTDLGHVTQLVLGRVRESKVIYMEANHDPVMLQNDPKRPWSLKQRILSRHGHLSNEAAAEALCQLASAELKHVFLGHLSQECNTPELARRVVAERLDKIGANHVALTVTQQAQPSITLDV